MLPRGWVAWTPIPTFGRRDGAVTHVALLKPRYIELLLDGTKTLECRLSRARIAPFGMVEPGQTVLFKRVGGGYAARAEVDRVRCFADLVPRDVDAIRRAFDEEVCGEASFWSGRRAGARYATLVWVRDVRAIASGPDIGRQYGRSWVVLSAGRGRASRRGETAMRHSA